MKMPDEFRRKPGQPLSRRRFMGQASCAAVSAIPLLNTILNLKMAGSVAAAEPGTVERSVIGFLVNRRAELEHQAGLLEQRLERLALGATDLPGLVAEIGAFLGRAVALEGRRGDALAVHAPLSDPATAAAVGRYLTGARSAALRVRLPGPRPGAGEAGALVLLGDRPPSELERVAVERIAGLLALELAREEAVRRARDAARRAEAMPGAGPPWVVLVARQITAGADPPVEQRESTRRELRLLAPVRRMVLRGDAESLELRLVLSANDDPGALALAGRIAAFLERPVAVSRPFVAAGDRPAAEAEARATLEAVEALAEVVATEPARGVSVRYVWRAEVFRPEMVPFEFLSPDIEKIKASMEQHIAESGEPMSIPGVRFHKEPIVSSRRVA